MTAEQFSNAMDLLDDGLLEEAAAARGGARRQMRRWRVWATLAACVCLIAAGAVAVSMTVRRGGSTADAGNGSGAVDGCDMIPGGIVPDLFVNGTIFHWNNVSQVVPGLPETYLPDGYTEYGLITSVTTAAPSEDSQLMAGFDASGTIYTSETTPEAVYVLMTTDWFSDNYIRFISDELAGGARIAWNGNWYRIQPYGIEASKLVRELPEGCERIGVLHCVGQDAIPQNDLETNCMTDGYGRSMEDREVFWQAGDPDYIYVYQKHSWREGEYDEYLKCSLWPDGGGD